jgi:NADH-quinone oxidoreductase subunit L
MTHAFFKALLFLGAGSVMHGMGGETDIRKMGGLGKYMPITQFTLTIAALALSGIFPLAGFWSKDEIIGAAFLKQYYLVFAVGIIVAGMTAFYSFRMIFMTFSGKERFEHHAIHVHESPSVMTIPLMILAVLSVIAGFAGFPPEAGWIQAFLSQVSGVAQAEAGAVGFTGTTVVLMIISTIVAVSGILLAWAMYVKHSISAEAIARRFQPLYTFFYNKWYFDELYNFIFVRSTIALANTLWWIDANIVDGAVNGVASAVSASSSGLKRVQTGLVQNYAFVMLLGILAMVSVYLIVALQQ